ncbi:hypothetical protein CBER1_02074 [Cercospora berteroae]|uniref:Uncharacterized protein n=1 Tax=Cercospora berteroae TaxID=357750 RepID=A0A2S6C8P8_9PEZI|nr:hypothetical protein CBER1_02074 [Cercospora berteroae]
MSEDTSKASPARQHPTWTLQQAYDIYDRAVDGEGLLRFTKVALAVVDTPTPMLDRIRLIELVETAVADPLETADLYTQANSPWQLAKWYQNLMQGKTEAEMQELRVLIHETGDVARRKQQAANMSEGEEDDGSEEDEGPDTTGQLGGSSKPVPSRSTSVEPPSIELDRNSDRPATSMSPEQTLVIRPSKSGAIAQSRSSMAIDLKSEPQIMEAVKGSERKAEASRSSKKESELRLMHTS